MVSHSHDGDRAGLLRIQELERQNLHLRYHNLKLLEHLEKLHPNGADAVIYVQVKQPEKDGE